MKVKQLKTKVSIDMSVSEYDTLFKYINKIDQRIATQYQIYLQKSRNDYTYQSRNGIELTLYLTMKIGCDHIKTINESKKPQNNNDLIC